MRYSPPLLRCCTIVVLLLLPAALPAEKLVVARSAVFGDYLEKRRVDGKLQPQSYPPKRQHEGSVRLDDIVVIGTVGP